jgi:hypothetical protein
MYDDYDLDYTFALDFNLDEDTYYEYHAQLDAHDLDEEYTRDAHDYDALAYIIHTHIRTSHHVSTQAPSYSNTRHHVL